MIWLVLGLIPVAFVLALPLVWVCIHIGRRMGALDSAGAIGHEKELREIPNTGGIAIFLAIALPLVGSISGLLLLPSSTLVDWFPAIEQYLPRLMGEAGAGGEGVGDVGGEGSVGGIWAAVALVGGMLVMHVMGLVDDRRSLGAFLKLGVQIAVALVLTIWFDVRLLELLGEVPSVVVTVVWIVAMTNAINFLDNMDGLAAGVSAIVAAMLMIATIVNGQWFIAATLALTVGALLGFLVFNFPPAKIFMGDGGSLVIGFLLAVLAARTTFYHNDLGGSWYGVFMPVVMLAIPLYDFCSVTLIRIRQGKSPFVGDQQHFSHRLVQRGLSQRGAVIVIWCFTVVTAVGGISLGQLEAWQAGLVFLQTALVLLTLAILEHTSRGRVG